jgi:aspartate carbamoyltransferase catalytic subunit
MPRTHVSQQSPIFKSFLDTRPFSSDDILALFNHADELSEFNRKFGKFYSPVSAAHDSNNERDRRVVFLLFLEPSTRTRLSFEMAALRLGHRVSILDAGAASSRTKGESDVDTVLNIVAMAPDALVIRYNKSPDLDSLLPTLSIPVISGGNATAAHPTQALLDAYTIYRERGHRDGLKGERVLIVGDIVHSRVARSNFDVLTKLGAEVAVCGPAALLPPETDIPGIKIFENLDEAISWSTVYMGLRMQFERHEPGETESSSLADFHENFGLNARRLKQLSQSALILHPGPINHGVEFAQGVTQDPRSRVLVQVSNGVLIRAALLSKIFEQRPR